MAEIVKRRLAGLHQVTAHVCDGCGTVTRVQITGISSEEIVDIYEPLEEGLRVCVTVAWPRGCLDTV